MAILSDHRLRAGLWVLLVALLNWSMPTPSLAAGVVVVVSNDSAVYREVAEAMRGELARMPGGPHAVSILSLAGLRDASLPEARAAVGVGVQATQALIAREPAIPVLGTLLPRTAYEKLHAEQARGRDSGRFSALYLDQPLGRQLELIRQALPGAKRVALLLGPESESLRDGLRTAASERHLSLNSQRVSDTTQLTRQLQTLLEEADVLLALPDSSVYNNQTVPHILLATYRQRVPVVGFSAAYARAGAVLALYSTPAQVGAQAAEMLRPALTGAALPPPQAPRQFVVATNAHVARSLDLNIEDGETLRRRLLHHEGRGRE